MIVPSMVEHAGPPSVCVSRLRNVDPGVVVATCHFDTTIRDNTVTLRDRHHAERYITFR